MKDAPRIWGGLDDFFEHPTRGWWLRPFPAASQEELKMKLEVKENDKSYSVRAEIPGVRKEDIKVDVDGAQVSISAEVKREKEEKEGDKVLHSERYYGRIGRSFTLPSDVEAQAAKAEYKDGLLELTLPKKAGTSSHRVSVG